VPPEYDFPGGCYAGIVVLKEEPYMECCGKYPDFGECPTNPNVRMCDEPHWGKVGLFDGDAWWSAYWPWCSYYCRGKGGGGACPSTADMNWHIAILEAARQYQWPEGEETFEDYENAMIKMKVETCFKFPTALDCKNVTDGCKRVRDGEDIVDNFGDPVTGHALEVFKQTCENACDDNTGDRPEWCDSSSSRPSATDSAARRPSESGLSSGATAGIVIGCVSGVATIAGSLVFFRVIRKKKMNGKWISA
jgi:hypothetical protein